MKPKVLKITWWTRSTLSALREGTLINNLFFFPSLERKHRSRITVGKNRGGKFFWIRLPLPPACPPGGPLRTLRISNFLGITRALCREYFSRIIIRCRKINSLSLFSRGKPYEWTYAGSRFPGAHVSYTMHSLHMREKKECTRGIKHASSSLQPATGGLSSSSSSGASFF